jgi:hypothetical protein
MVEMRLDSLQRSQLRAMGFTHAVVIAKDVSIKVVGSVESVFTRKSDAIDECGRLNRIYSQFELESHEIVEL